MKYVLIILLIVAAGAFILFTSGGPAENAPGTTPAIGEEIDHTVSVEVTIPDGTYQLKSGSTVTWAGKKPRIVGYVDSGTLNVKSGSFTQAEGEVNGTITFDMTSIQAESTGRGSGAEMLSGHLQSDDFFAVETFPEATLEITDLEPREVLNNTNFNATGNLTIKGITQPVSFPVGVSVADDGVLTVSGRTALDRTLWDVRYGSDKFFDNLADNVIADAFTVSFVVQFSPVLGAGE